MPHQRPIATVTYFADDPSKRQRDRHAQPSLSAHAVIYGHFHPRRHLITAAEYRRARAKAFRIWRQETCVHQAV